MSLPHFKEFGYEAEVVVVDELYGDMKEDHLLLQSIPEDIKIHKVRAFNKQWTSIVGLGSLALRSLWFYNKTVTRLLSHHNFDLIYFSTTQFPVMILGAYWKKKFGIPFVIDMQDPWHSDFYKQNPQVKKPKKYWFSHRLNKMLEPLTMKQVDGLISVSKNYAEILKQRYSHIGTVPTLVLPFGYSECDFQIAENNKRTLGNYLHDNKFNVVYIGRGGGDMKAAVCILFESFKKLLSQNPQVSTMHFYFIGTSYAPKGQGAYSILPIAQKFGLEEFVTEHTDRISFYESIANLQQADMLFIPGSKDPAYVASKVFNYIRANKPLLAIFNKESSVFKTIVDLKAGVVVDLNNREEAIELTAKMLLNTYLQNYDWEQDLEKLKLHSSRKMTHKQCILFDMVLSKTNKNVD